MAVVQLAGGQQLQVGRTGFATGYCPVSSSSGRRTGLRRSWKAFGKKAKMKIPRKITVFRMLVSNGMLLIGLEIDVEL